MEKKYERKGTYNNKGIKQEKKTTEDKNDDEIGRINYDTDTPPYDGGGGRLCRRFRGVGGHLH